jgi:rubrerythrin
MLERRTIQQLREQLDAEREKVQTLVDALKQLSENHYDPTMRNVAKDALAKVKEGKTDCWKCEKCGKALGWNEPVICDSCAEDNREARQNVLG